MSRRIFKLTFLQPYKPEFTTNRIGRGIIDRWKGVHELIAMLFLCVLDCCLARFCRNPASLISWQDEPAHFKDKLIAPVLFPVTDIANWLTFEKDRKHVIGFRQI